MAPKVKIILPSGSIFGRLTVIQQEYLPNTPGRAKHGFTRGLRGYRCKCICNNECVVPSANLINGSVSSCGCLQIEAALRNLEFTKEVNTTHGLYNHYLYGTWSSMLVRCFSEKHVHYARYGGRGITVCSDWQDVTNFINYIENNLGPRPLGYTLDRIDNDGDYCPGNVRWASQKEQVHNQSIDSKFSTELINTMQKLRDSGISTIEIANTCGVTISVVYRFTKHKNKWVHNCTNMST